MEPINFSRNSWHYRLANTYTPFTISSNIDICSYVRYVIVGMFQAALFSALLGGLLGSVAIFIETIVISFIYDVSYLDIADKDAHTGGVIALIMCFIAIVIGLNKFFYSDLYFKLVDDSRDRRYARSLRRQERQPSFIKRAWESFHNKICFYVNFTDD